MSGETNGCEAIQETIVEWLSRPSTAVAALLPAEAAAHVLVCDSCRGFAEQDAVIATLVRTDPSPVPQALAWDDLGAAVERAVRPAAVPPHRRAQLGLHGVGRRRDDRVGLVRRSARAERRTPWERSRRACAS